MTVQRLPDWPELLCAAIEERRSIQFQWGPNDCVSCASSIIAKFTCTDIMKAYRGSYSSALGAMRLFKEHGGFLDLVDKTCEEHGVLTIPNGFAGRGDLSAHKLDGRISLAIVSGAGWSWAPCKNGLTILPMETAIKSWRVN